MAAFAGGRCALGSFVAWAMHADHPMLDVYFFANARFTAASRAGGSCHRRAVPARPGAGAAGQAGDDSDASLVDRERRGLPALELVVDVTVAVFGHRLMVTGMIIDDEMPERLADLLVHGIATDPRVAEQSCRS